MENNLNSIIQDTIERLMSQRDDLITEIRNCSENSINSSIKIIELDKQIVSIDNKIESYMDKTK